jgi:hypothetical protein
MAASVSVRRGCRRRRCRIRFRSSGGGKPNRFVTTAIEIEIDDATQRVAAGVELGFIGKVLRLLKSMNDARPLWDAAGGSASAADCDASG